MPTVVPHTPVGLAYGLEETDQDKLGEIRNSSSADFRNPDNQQSRSTSFFNQGELANQRQATAQTGQYQRGELEEGQERVAETAKQDARELSLRAQQIQQDAALRGATIQNEAAYRQATLEMQQNKLSSLNDYRGETVADRQQALGDAFTKTLLRPNSVASKLTQIQSSTRLFCSCSSSVRARIRNGRIRTSNVFTPPRAITRLALRRVIAESNWNRSSTSRRERGNCGRNWRHNRRRRTTPARRLIKRPWPMR